MLPKIDKSRAKLIISLRTITKIDKQLKNYKRTMRGVSKQANEYY